MTFQEWLGGLSLPFHLLLVAAFLMIVGIVYMLVDAVFDHFGDRHYYTYPSRTPATAPVTRQDRRKLGRPRQRASVGSAATRARQRREREARAARL